MIYLNVIIDAIKENLIIIGVGVLGMLSVIGMFLPKNSKLKKAIKFLTKK
jgi:ABC-type enterobactin transport system permease subunit